MQRHGELAIHHTQSVISLGRCRRSQEEESANQVECHHNRDYFVSSEPGLVKLPPQMKKRHYRPVVDEMTMPLKSSSIYLRTRACDIPAADSLKPLIFSSGPFKICTAYYGRLRLFNHSTHLDSQA